jgi:hypothetical protein
MVMDAPHATVDPFSSNSRPVTACVWMRECDAWVWMQYMRLPDPFSSNLKVCEAACVDAGV